MKNLWHRAKWGVLLALVGCAIVSASLLPGPGLDDAWTRDVLMTVGASVALFAVFYLLTRSLDRHLDQVSADTARQVEEVRADTTHRVEQVRTEAAEASTLGRGLRKHTGEVLVADALLTGLADLLEAALSHPERRPAIELCPPQWMVCDWGVIAYGNSRIYGVNLNTLQTSPTISTDAANKLWVDRESWDAASEVALALFPRRADVWTTRSTDEPPF